MDNEAKALSQQVKVSGQEIEDALREKASDGASKLKKRNELASGKRLSMTPKRFLEMISADSGFKVNEENPMKTVEEILEQARRESVELDEIYGRNEKPPELRLKDVTASG